MRNTIPRILILVVLLGVPVAVLAGTGKLPAMMGGETITIAEDEVVDRNFYAAGNAVTINGEVQGDVVVAANTVRITGTVGGDVIAAGNGVTIEGDVGGNVRVAGADVELRGTIARNLMVFSGSVFIAENASVGWSAMAFGGTVEHAGAIGGHLDAWSASTIISGSVGGDGNVHAGDEQSTIQVTKTAAIGGDFTYWSGPDATIASGATIEGTTTKNAVEPFLNMKLPSAAALAGLHVVFKLALALGAIVTGLVLVMFTPGLMKKTTDLMLTTAGPTIGWGFLSLVVTPLLGFFLLVTVVGIPLGAALFGLYALAMYGATIVAGIGLGLLLLGKRAGAEKRQHLLLATLLGIVVYSLLTAIPIIGWAIGLVGSAWGLGGLVRYKWGKVKEENKEAF